MVYEHHGWVGLLVVSLGWKLAWHLQVLGRLVIRAEVSRPVPAQEPLGSVSVVRTVFSDRDLASGDGATEGNSNKLYVWGNLLNNLDQRIGRVSHAYCWAVC